MKKSLWMRLAAVFAVLMLAIAMATPAYAATKTVKKQAFTTKTSVIKKKATTVKKGKTTLVVAKGQGYVKFKAPATKVYSFTFSGLKSKSAGSAFVEVQTQDKSSPSYSFLTDVKTQGGKHDTLWLSVSGYRDKYNKGVNKCIASRYGKKKLAKGQEIFFFFYNGSSKTTANLVIK